MYKYTVNGKQKKRKKGKAVERRVRSVKKKGVSPGTFLKRLVVGLKYTLCFLLFLGFLAVASAGTYRFYKSGDFFILRDVVCQGNSQLSRNDILNMLHLELGRKLLDIPVGKLREVLLKHPWVQDAEVSRSYPSRLKILLQEKRPVALCFLPARRDGLVRDYLGPGRTGKGERSQWYGISESGELLPDISLYNVNFPVTELLPKKDSAALHALTRFLCAARDQYPGIYNTMSQINYLGRSEFAVYTRDNRLKFIISMEEDVGTVLEMWGLLVSRKGDQLMKGQTVDLRIKGFAYVK
jgi:hypothetical protein